MRDLVTDIEAGILLSDAEPPKGSEARVPAGLPKRFYKDVTVVEGEGGFSVQLDGRPAKSPGRAVLLLPTLAAAQMIADEFLAQETVINPMTMPVYRLANTIVDGVSNEREAVAEDIVKFSGTDMLCYRADGPDRLVKRENAAWNPMLEWAENLLGQRFAVAQGIMHVQQSPAVLNAVAAYVGDRLEPFRLGSMHVMTTLTGSALLAFAVEAAKLTAKEAWTIAHIDEDWQIELWGQDHEAVARRNAKWKDMDAADRLLKAI